MSNLELWNKVCTTDPKYTKKVSLGRTFTAIDPMYQVMKATEVLGIAGEGWGFSVEDTKFLPTDQVAMKVRVWIRTRDNWIEHWGQNGLFADNKKEKVDTDCMKKATTDGITKCLSYFGFNADVFLGKFDDNKYVESLKSGIEGGVLDDDARKQADDMFIEQLEAAFNLCKSTNDVNEVITTKVKQSLTKLAKNNNGAFLKLQKRKNDLLAAFKPQEDELLNQFEVA